MQKRKEGERKINNEVLLCFTQHLLKFYFFCIHVGDQVEVKRANFSIYVSFYFALINIRTLTFYYLLITTTLEISKNKNV